MRRVPLAFLFGGFLISTVADAWFLGVEYHGEFWWSHVYGFFSLFGFIGCLAIMLVAKFILGPWVQRNENYYHQKTSP
ncbi:MAG: hypothetical protein ACREQ7_20835 [Candidatus Binatia bacterium]